MSMFEAPLVCWLLVAVQIAGLSSACMVRLSEGSRYQSTCHWLFWCCFALLGAATLVCLDMGPGCWLTSGATLSLMVLSATCDFASPNQAVIC